MEKYFLRLMAFLINRKLYEKIINFIKEKNKEAQYIVSNCAGAQLIGASGIANGKK